MSEHYDPDCETCGSSSHYTHQHDAFARRAEEKARSNLPTTVPLPPPTIDTSSAIKVHVRYSASYYGGPYRPDDPPNIVGVFTSEAKAKAEATRYQCVIEHYGALRSDGRVLILLGPEAYPLDVTVVEARRRLRSSALEKLTPEERWALGVER